MSTNYDAIIIGAGIMGCSTAFQLARRGLKVLILEKEGVGAGSTGKSSAIIRQHYSNELTARMAHYSLGVFQNFAQEVGDECGFTETGFVALTSAKDRAGLAANVALQQRVGIRTAMIEPAQVAELMPELEQTDLVAAAYEPESGYADPYLTVTAYARAARGLGATLRTHTPVTGLRFQGGKVMGVTTPTEQFNSPRVLNCAGPWGGPVARMAGVEMPINGCRVQVAFFRRPPGHEAPHPVVADFVHATYFRAETGGLTLAGLIDPSEANAIVDPDNYREQMDMDFMLDVGERLVRRYPAMEMAQSTGGFAALYAITPDWHPIVDEAPAGSGLFHCAGFSGHGFKLGPAAGLMLADLVMGVADPLFDPSLFRLQRYAEGQPVTGQYEYSIAG